MNEQNFNRPILITGLPRSGTSLISGIIATCGAWSGSTVPGNQENIKGYYEHTRLRELVNKAILKQLGCDPLGVKVLPQIDRLPKISDFKNVVVQNLLADGYRGDAPWMFKDAKMLLLWPYYVDAFPKARWIIVRRERAQVIDSCLRTSFMKQHSQERAFWNTWAIEYEKRIEQLKSSNADCIEISSNEVVQPEGRKALKKLVRKLKLNWNKNAVDQFIEPTVWHKS
jgi:hypothetical protein